MNKNLKKVISAAAALAVSASSIAAFAASYPDVADTASYAQAVEELSTLGVINGYDDGTFGPDNNITRAEFAKMTVYAIGEDDVEQANSAAGQDTQFTDVPGTHWAAGWVKQGTVDGFINGYSDTEFGPEDNITYAQAVKMLVCAVGYDSYAQKAGGWPSGYLSYGVRLGITSGVKAATDEIVTRAQVAQMVDNAMKAPICVQDYETNAWGNQAVTYNPKDTTSVVDKDTYQTLLDYGHDVYDVYGRVTGTLQTQAVSTNDKVKINIEKANNFDGYQVTTKYESSLYTNLTVYAGNSGAENYLFTYAEMLIQKDDNDDFTILTVYPQGQNSEATFEAADYDDSKSTTTNVYAYLNGKDSKSTSYKLDTTKLYGGVQGGFYVNGTQIDVSDAEKYTAAVEAYIYNNGTGEVKLIDSPEEGKSSADGSYDYIMVTKYADAIVDSVRVDSDTETTIYFDNMASGVDSSWDIDTDDDGYYYSFKLNGAEISPADIQEGDVLSIAYDVTGNFDDSTTYSVLVSRDVATGTVNSISPDDNALDYEYTLSDGNVYKLADPTSLASTKDLESGEEYTLYLDAFGKVVKADQEATSKLIGIIDSVYNADGDQYYANIITKTGEKVKVSIKNEDKYKTYKALCYGDDGAKKDITERVYNYSLNSSNEVTIKAQEQVKNKDNSQLTYKASTNKLGSYKINDAITSLLDISDYDDDGTVSAITSSGLDDDEDYEAYAFGKNSSDNSYQLILVKAEGTGFSTDSQVVVYSKYGTQNTDDGDKTTIYAYANGESTTTAYILDDDAKFVTGYDGDEVAVAAATLDKIPYVEGDLLVLKTNTSGEVTKVVPMFESNGLLKSGYDNLYKKATASKTALSDIIAPANGFAEAYFADKKSSDQVSFQFGPIIDKSDSDITLGEYNYNDKAVTNTNTLDDLSFDSDVTVYVYNYDKGNGYRVTAGAKGSIVKTQVASANCIADTTLGIEESDKSLIDWTSFGNLNAPTSTYGQVNYAFVKLVDDDVTEVYVITPSTSRK